MGSGLVKQIPSVLDRVKALEQGYTSLNQLVSNVAEAVNGAFAQNDQRHQTTEAVLDAITSVLGVQAIQEALNANARKKVDERTEAAKASLEAAVKEGKIQSSDVIGPTSIFVGRGLDKDGNEIYPGWEHTFFKSLSAEFKESVLGKKVGDVVDMGDGKRFEILETYNVVEAAAPSTQEQAQLETPSVDEPKDADDALEEYLASTKTEGDPALQN